MSRPPTLITLAGTEPVSLADAKLHLRVTASDEDARITALITTARLTIERRTGRTLRQATWELRLEAFPSWEITLPLPPLQSVDSVKYTDGAGVEQTISSGDYVVETPAGPMAAPGRLWPAYDKAWPTARAEINAVRIRFTAAGSVPQDLVDAMLLVLGDLYANRETSIAAPGASVNPALAALTDDYRVAWA